MEQGSVLRTSAQLTNLGLIRHFVTDVANGFGADPAVLRGILLAVDEAATNVIVHGYDGAEGWIEVEVGRQGENLVIVLRDAAPLYNPLDAKEPDLDAPPELRPVGGMGVHLIRQTMDEVRHRATPEGGNELTLVRRI